MAKSWTKSFSPLAIYEIAGSHGSLIPINAKRLIDGERLTVNRSVWLGKEQSPKSESKLPPRARRELVAVLLYTESLEGCRHWRSTQSVSLFVCPKGSIQAIICLEVEMQLLGRRPDRSIRLDANGSGELRRFKTEARNFAAMPLIRRMTGHRNLCPDLGLDSSRGESCLKIAVIGHSYSGAVLTLQRRLSVGHVP